MSKKNIIIILFFILIILCCLFIIKYKIITPIYYISFDKLEKVVISYNPTNSLFEEYHSIKEYPGLENITICQFETKEQSFIELLENNYRNKIVKDYYDTDNILYVEGNFKIIINDSISICSRNYKEFFLIYKDKFILIEENNEIFDKMVELIINHSK
ncbi:MAG: hypothetical protein J6A36_04755 [Clostridia bacterium]|nr:hypothetical protein [Clostridia bacterium]